MQWYVKLVLFLILLGFILTFIFLTWWAAIIYILVCVLLLFLISFGLNYHIESTIVKQFAILNQQLQVNFYSPESLTFGSWFATFSKQLLRYIFSFGKKTFNLFTQVSYPRLQGIYLNRHFTMFTYEDEQQNMNTIITIDAMHYGKTFVVEKKAEEKFWTKAYWKKRSPFAKPPTITGHEDFDRHFTLESNDFRFALTLLDDTIKNILAVDALYKEGKLLTNQSQLIYQEKTTIMDEEDRERFEQIILAMYMIAERMRLMRR